MSILEEATFKNIFFYFSELAEKNNLKMLPARNYLLLPEQNVGRDLDLIVLLKDLKIWTRVIKEISKKFDLKLEFGPSYRYCHQFHLSNKEFHLEIDLLVRFEWRGIKWLENCEVVSFSKKYKNNLYIPNSDHEFFITFNHSYLHGGFYPKKYSKKLIHLYSLEKEKILNLMKNIYGKKNSKTILRFICKEDFNSLNEINKKIRLNVILKSFMRNPLKIFMRCLLSYLYDFYLKSNLHGKRLNN